MNGEQMSDDSQYYLGLGSRFDSGPSPAMQALGFREESRQADLLHRWLDLADLTHTMALDESHAIPQAASRRLIAALLDLHQLAPVELGYRSGDGDAYNSRERVLRERLGEDAGWLSFGRTRREAVRQAFGLACRDLLLTLHRAVNTQAGVLAGLADHHKRTWWADQTYWQPAQVSTLGHYLLSFGFESQRHLGRIEVAWERCGLVPMAAGGVAGTRVPIVPEQYRRRLALRTPPTTTRDAMWSVDGLLDLVMVAEQVTLTATRLAEDLLVYATEPFSWVRLADAHCRASVYLPQKRNPYALIAIRGAHAVVSGRLAGIVTSVHTGSAQTDNWIYNYGEAAECLDIAVRVTNLLAEVMAAAQFDVDRLAASALAGFSEAADRAEELALREGLDYRAAHEAVAAEVRAAERQGGGQLADAARLADIVAARRGEGGAAPDDLAVSITQLRAQLTTRAQWANTATEQAHSAETALLDDARRLIATDGHSSATSQR